MSSFGAKRKPRIIQTLDDEDDDASLLIGGSEGTKDIPIAPIKFGRNKPSKSSSLRKSINFNDKDEPTLVIAASLVRDVGTASSTNEDDDGASSVAIQPSLSRSGSTKQKKRASTSRLSFGPSEPASTIEGDSTSGQPEISTPRKTLSQRALENNALRKSASSQGLALRFGAEEERPRYSKEYLEELQSSTPNTPQNLASLRVADDGDVMDLDPSELDGALIVQSQDVTWRSPSGQALVAQRPPANANILTEAEIRERKERRLRLAHEAEFISLEGGSDEEEEGSGRVSVRFESKKKASESRLIAEDEDLGEGYDEFVSDGGLALGRKAEREAEKRHRQEMAELIGAADGGSDAESDDSEAERRAAYEAAQRRAGLGGLHRLDDEGGMDSGGGVNIIPRMKPLPELQDVLQRMRSLVQGLEDEAARKRARIADLEKERAEILARENEVQEELNKTSAKYQAVMGSAAAAGDMAKLVSQSPLRPLPPGMAGDFPVERGLESFGTPTKRPDVEMT